jgi:plasmid stabilization system protein ParE
MGPGISTPLGFEIIPEADQMGAPYRHLLFGNYRIIYQVAANEVDVLAVVHAGRKLARALLGLPPESEKKD